MKKESVKITKVACYSSSKFEITSNGKEELVTKLVEIVPKTQKVQDILEEVMMMKDNPIIFLGYEQHIIGYESKSYALIYDTIGIVTQIADENMQYDEQNGNTVSDWDEYYDEAASMVYDGQLLQVSLITGRNEEADVDENSDPILMTSF
jgi:hypothetical protein